MHAELIARLESLEGPDREVDLAIGLAIGGWTVTREGPYGTVEVPGEGSYPAHPGSLYPALTESLDAAIALVERVLPGQWADILRQAISDMGREFAWHIRIKQEPPELLCKFVLIAALRALDQKEAGE